MCSASLSVEAGLMHVEMHGGVSRLLEICGHVEILLENGKWHFLLVGGFQSYHWQPQLVA